MENEIQILNSIEKMKNATQRDIAKTTGMSLGNVNTLIKRLVSKGLIKIEKLNTKTIRYILTSQGIKEKAEATYNYILFSYKFINGIDARIDALLCDSTEIVNKGIVLYGRHDEIYTMLCNKFDHKKIVYNQILEDPIKESEIVKYIQEFGKKMVNVKDFLIITWNPEYVVKFKQNDVEIVNLLEII